MHFSKPNTKLRWRVRTSKKKKVTNILYLCKRTQFIGLGCEMLPVTEVAIGLRKILRVLWCWRQRRDVRVFFFVIIRPAVEDFRRTFRQIRYRDGTFLIYRMSWDRWVCSNDVNSFGWLWKRVNLKKSVLTIKFSTWRKTWICRSIMHAQKHNKCWNLILNYLKTTSIWFVTMHWLSFAVIVWLTIHISLPVVEILACRFYTN
jgi:transposase InsO family protein